MTTETTCFKCHRQLSAENNDWCARNDRDELLCGACWEPEQSDPAAPLSPLPEARIEALLKVFDLMPIGETTPETRWSARDQRFGIAFRQIAPEVLDALRELLTLREKLVEAGINYSRNAEAWSATCDVIRQEKAAVQAESDGRLSALLTLRQRMAEAVRLLKKAPYGSMVPDDVRLFLKESKR